MPHLIIRNVSEERLLAASHRLAERLSQAIGCDRSWITLDLENSVRIQDGAREAGTPYVEVHWFRRAEDVKKAAAKIISEELRGASKYVTAVFIEIDPCDYFEDGETVQ